MLRESISFGAKRRRGFMRASADLSAPSRQLPERMETILPFLPGSGGIVFYSNQVEPSFTNPCLKAPVFTQGVNLIIRCLLSARGLQPACYAPFKVCRMQQMSILLLKLTKAIRCRRTGITVRGNSINTHLVTHVFRR